MDVGGAEEGRRNVTVCTEHVGTEEERKALLGIPGSAKSLFAPGDTRELRRR
jgi:hypothetical protein